MLWDLVLKLFLLKKVHMSLVNSARNPHNKNAMLGNTQNALPKWRLIVEFSDNTIINHLKISKTEHRKTSSRWKQPNKYYHFIITYANFKSQLDLNQQIQKQPIGTCMYGHNGWSYHNMVHPHACYDTHLVEMVLLHMQSIVSVEKCGFWVMF